MKLVKLPYGRAPLVAGIMPGILGALLCAAALAADQPDATHPVQAIWKPIEINYSYTAFTTAYNCDAYEAKVKKMLLALGAPPQTKVDAHGCVDLNRPSRNFFVTITTATPVPADQADKVVNKSQQKLLDRLGTKNRLSTDPFPAAWKTVDLSRDLRFDLGPGDCELMEGLRDNVLPKLSTKVVSERIQCTPKQLSIQTPELKVAALAPLPKPDQPGAAKDR